jgi:hypothetical protein
MEGELFEANKLKEVYIGVRLRCREARDRRQRCRCQGPGEDASSRDCCVVLDSNASVHVQGYERKRGWVVKGTRRVDGKRSRG